VQNTGSIVAGGASEGKVCGLKREVPKFISEEYAARSEPFSWN